MGEKEIVEKSASEAKAVKEDAEADMAAAQPELDAADRALKNLKKEMITELSSFNSPASEVVEVVGAVMVLLKEKSDWKSAKKIIGKAGDFLKTLQTYDVTKTSEGVLKKLRDKYIKQANFNPKDVRVKSEAAANLCEWVIAMSKYQSVWKKIMPKKAKLAEVTQVLNAAQAELDQKMIMVNEAKATVARLEAELQEAIDKKNEYEFKQN